MKKKLLILCLALVTGVSFAQTIQLTNGGSTTLSGTTSANPVSAYFEYNHFQVVYTAAELNAAGITGAKSVTQLGWYVSTAPASALPTYKIRMGNTTATNSATNDNSALTEVYSVASYAPVAGGFDMRTLNGSFIWDGTSNLLVDVCYGAAPYVSPYGEVRTYAATTTSGSRRVRCDACGSQCGSATNTTNTFKPQVSLTFAAPPSCLNVGAVTVTPGTTTAALSWGTVAGATGYQWAVTTSATPPASGTAVATNSANASGLTANTAYYAHVRTACSGGTFSTWSTTAFNTLCAATNIPYSENFDGVTAPSIPSCITVQNVNGSNTWGNFSTPSTIIISTPNSMVYTYNSTVAADDWFFTQGLNLTAGVSYRLTFKWKSNPSFPESFEVKYGTAANAASMTSGTLYTNTNAANSTVQTQTADFIPSASGVYYLGFHCNSLADQDFLSIDDITVNVSPTCGAPTALNVVVNANNTSGTASWTAPSVGTPTGYEVVVDQVAADPAGSGAPVAGTSTTFSVAVPFATYYLHVRTNCGAGNFSAWATIPFVTLANDNPCGAIPLTLGGPQDCGNTTLSTSTSDPALACSAPNNTVWYSYTPSSNGSVDIKLSQSGAGTQLNGWLQIYTATGTCPSLTLTQVNTAACLGNIDLTTVVSGTLTTPSLTAGTTYYIMLDGFSGASGAYCIQLLAPPPPPACVTNISPANAATGVAISPNTPISWNAAATATSYDVFFGTTNPPTVNIGNVVAPATTVNVTGLAYSTTYYWYIVPKNSGGSATACSTNVTSFTTIAPPPNCVPLTTSGCTLSDRLELFRLKGEASELLINTGTTCAANAYTDTTDHPIVIDLARGKCYWGQIKAGTTGDYLTLWLDANDNGIYENSERLINNLPAASASAGNINLFIPQTTATGNHTLRARLVYYAAAPTSSTDPCGSYTYSDTKDFKVNITAGGASYTVSSYATVGSCYTGSGDITIDPASNNNANYVPLVDSLNRLIAQVYPQGNDLGTVRASYYHNNGPVRQDPNGIYYMDRNITVTVTKQPTSAYNIRLPYLNSELNALIAQPGSGVTSQFDLVTTKNGDGCRTAVLFPGTVYLPTGFGSISGDRFIDVTNLTGFSSFYLHGGSFPIPVNLLSFTAQRISNKVNQLNWSTSQEQNTSHFVLERSTDGRNFTTIGQVTAVGNSSVQQNYAYTDNSPVIGINYYRLKMVDRDNSYKYSWIRNVRNEGIADVAIYPNPVKDMMSVSINSDKAGLSTITICDVSGKSIYRKNVAVAQGSNTISIGTDNIAAGSYIIKVQLNEDFVVRKFNKL